MQRYLKKRSWRALYQRVVGRQLARIRLVSGTHGECKNRGGLFVSITPSSAPVGMQFCGLSKKSHFGKLDSHFTSCYCKCSYRIFNKRYDKVTVIHRTSGWTYSSSHVETLSYVAYLCPLQDTALSLFHNIMTCSCTLCFSTCKINTFREARGLIALAKLKGHGSSYSRPQIIYRPAKLQARVIDINININAAASPLLYGLWTELQTANNYITYQ